jgi:putative ABC transport system permease protein
MAETWNNLLHAARALAKNKAFTLVAVLTLALGIGANTAIFSVVDAVLLKPLAFPRPESLVRLEEHHSGSGCVGFGACDWPEFTYANFADIATHTCTLDHLAAFRQWLFTITGEGEPQNIDGYLVSAEFFNALGIAPQLGRTFLPEETQPGNDSVVVLSNSFWRGRFGADPHILGKTTKLNGRATHIIGVMPANFRFPEDAKLWAPLALDAPLRTNRRAHLYIVIGRLKRGATLDQARTETAALAVAIDAQNKKIDPGWTAYPAPLLSRLVAPVRLPIFVLLAAVGLVLLIACVNVANLLLARAAGRTREIAVRVTLGASKGRVLAQLLTESLLLAGLSSVLGVLLAVFGLPAVIRLNPGNIPRLQDAAMDWRVLVFTALVTALTGVLFGLVPAFQAFRIDLQDSLRDSRRNTTGKGQTRLRHILVVAEFAFALVLLTGAGLLSNTFLRLLHVPLGFDPKNVLTLQLFLPHATESASDFRTTQTLAAVLEKVRAIPGVESAGLTNSLPVQGGVSTDFAIVGRPPVKPDEEPSADIKIIDSGYLRTMRIPLLQGREISDRDGAHAPRIMLINQTMAKQFWPRENPIGHRVTMKDWGPPLTGEIVGVVADVKAGPPEEPVKPMIYWPYPQFPSLFNDIVVRTTGDPLSLVSGIKAQVYSVNPEQPVSQIRTMEDVIGESLAQRRFSLVLIGIFAGVSLVLAAVGVAGVMAFLVAQRTQEMGIRMALGAQRTDIFALVFREGLRMTVLGVVVGLFGASLLTRLMVGMLYQVKPGDPLTFALAATLLSTIALVACYMPVRSATRVDPLVALRYE